MPAHALLSPQWLRKSKPSSAPQRGWRFQSPSAAKSWTSSSGFLAEQVVNALPRKTRLRSNLSDRDACRLSAAAPLLKLSSGLSAGLSSPLAPGCRSTYGLDDLCVGHSVRLLDKCSTVKYIDNMAPIDRNNPIRAASSDSPYSLMEFMKDYPDDATYLEHLWRTR